MHESDRNRLSKRLTALLLAASDLRQVEAAARLLEMKSGLHERRALETAISVCYARGFTQSSLCRLSQNEFEPSDPGLAEVHRMLLSHRDKVYAHTDKDGGRLAGLNLPDEGVGTSVWEQWVPFPRDAVPVSVSAALVSRRRPPPGR